MSPVVSVGLSVVLSYLAGSFPTSIIIGKLFFGRDPRLEGSGNAGGTNSFRVFGWKAGLAVSLLDVAKGALAAGLLSRLVPADVLPPEASMMLCGLAAVAGHVWTVFAGFRGGKGVATAAGAILVFAPASFGAALLGFALVLLSTGIVSAASITAAVVFSASALIIELSGPAPSGWLIGFACLAAPFIMFTHRSNIGRLARGEEKRFDKLALLGKLFRRRTGK
ncbi:MAG: glycerol-3-phosphate 1-O-acyltransferase PlsY [Spirochaetales bacterium]|nr:glycerol-3-phosphate 1-O-acyltransferase PlsY [Spirochaetales bacterium]